MRCRKLHASLLFAAALSSGCISYRSLARDSVNYNLAVEQGQNRVLLLNIIRASKRYPLYLTSIAKVTGSNSASFSLEAALPFSNKGDSSSTATPGGSVEVNPTFDVPVLDSQEFTRGFLAPVKADLLAYYWDQGWPQELLMHLLVSKVRVSAFRKDYYLFNHPHFEDERLCQFEKFGRWVNVFLLAGDPSFETLEEEVDIGPALSEAESRHLEELIELGKSESLVLEPSARGFQLRRAKSALALSVAEGGVQTIYEWTRAAAEMPCDEHEPETLSSVAAGELPGDADQVTSYGRAVEHGRERGELKITLFLRSPEAVLYYLGQLLRVEEQHVVPRICVAGRLEPLFVARVPRAQCGRARQVELDYQGVEYTIIGGLGEAEDHPSCKRDRILAPWAELRDELLRKAELDCNPGRTMHSLSLLTQLINLQKSAKDLPVTTTVRTVGN